MVQAVLLAAGFGTRLKPYTDILPKPLLPFNGKPILEHNINWLNGNDVTDIIVCISYLGDIIKSYLKNRVKYMVTEKPLGTARQLKSAEQYITDEYFICVYADSIYKFDLKNAIEETNRVMDKTPSGLGTIITVPSKLRSPYGFIDTIDGKVVAWREKPELIGNISIGCFIFKKRFLTYINNTNTEMNTAISAALKNQETLFEYRVDLESVIFPETLFTL
jgi:NDP-sugar pyrophosphorylase family protein